MDPLRLLIIGPGRAGMSLAIAARAAGHTIDAVVGRDRDHAATAAADLGVDRLGLGDDLPPADVVVIAVRDGAIGPVAQALAEGRPSWDAAVHLSGLISVAALAALGETGIRIGSFHPLQTLPNPQRGAERLAGASIAITASPPLDAILDAFARSLGAEPFPLEDAAKPLYHAAAAAAANFPVVALAMARDLFEAAGVEFAAARPLVKAIVANSFELGPRAALTGPVARGDIETVASQIDSVNQAAPEWRNSFVEMVGELARLTGRRDQFADLVARWGATS